VRHLLSHGAVLTLGSSLKLFEQRIRKILDVRVLSATLHESA
jgi:hypothetical protein